MGIHQFLFKKCSLDLILCAGFVEGLRRGWRGGAWGRAWETCIFVSKILSLSYSWCRFCRDF